MERAIQIAIALTAALWLTACKVNKSAHPLSPTVAGPIPGVTITTPRTVAPMAGARIPPGQQPVTLVIDNALTSGVRPITYLLEIATDVDFATKVYAQQGVPPGANGRTSFVLTQALPGGRTYYWHARAQDGANAGAFTPPNFFEILTQAVIGVPTPLAPVNGQAISTLTPRLVAQNAIRTGSVGPLVYTISMNASSAFGAATAVGAWTVAEQADRTAFDVPSGVLAYGRQYFWVIRAADAQTTGDWSPVQSFVTPVGLRAGGSGLARGWEPGDWSGE
jgi:hypothetical protein